MAGIGIENRTATTRVDRKFPADIPVAPVVFVPRQDIDRQLGIVGNATHAQLNHITVTRREGVTRERGVELQLLAVARKRHLDLQIPGISRQHGMTAARPERRHSGRRTLLSGEIRGRELHHAAAALGDETVGIFADLVTARPGQTPQLQTVARDLQRPHDLALARSDPHVDIRTHPVEAHLGNIVFRPFRGVDHLPVRQSHVIGTVRKVGIAARIRHRGAGRNGRREVVEIVSPAPENQLPRSVIRGIAELIDSRCDDRALGVGDLVGVLIHGALALRVRAGLVDHHAERSPHGKTVGMLHIGTRIGGRRQNLLALALHAAGRGFFIVGPQTVHIRPIIRVQVSHPDKAGIGIARRRGPVIVVVVLPRFHPIREPPVVGKRRILNHVRHDVIHLVVGRQAKFQRQTIFRRLGPRHRLLLGGTPVAVNP